MVRRALFILVLAAICPPAFAQQPQCDSAAFREAVSSASAAITLLHEKNGKIVQENLQKLRALNNWREAEYLANATPFVRDETTVSLDAANRALLTKVQSLDAANANTETGRCEMLNELRNAMQKVVANTAAKWEHMIDKVNRAVVRPIQAGFTR